MQYKKLWIALGLVMAISFTVLGVVGYKGISNGPPTPSKVVTADGRMLFTGETIRNGQNVWQSTGGQEIGTIWGHGAYVAPDWSADYLHRQSVIVLDRWARQQGFANYAGYAGRTASWLAGPAHRSHASQFVRCGHRHASCSTTTARPLSMNWPLTMRTFMARDETHTQFLPAL